MRHMKNEGHTPGGMHENEEANEEVEKSGGHVGRHHRARGGRTEPVHIYNAEGSPTVKEAEDEEPDFERGGRTRRRHARGGNAHGEHAVMRADRVGSGPAACGAVPAEGVAHGGVAHHGHRGGAHHDGPHHGHHVEHHTHLHAKRGGHMARAAGGSVPATEGLAHGGAAHHGHRGGAHHDGPHHGHHVEHHTHMRRGGHKRADGGAVPATEGLARGGRAGHSPYSSGRHITPPEDAKGARGYEGVPVPPER